MDQRIARHRDLFALLAAVAVAIAGWAVTWLALAVTVDGMPASAGDLIGMAGEGLAFGVPFAIAAIVVAGAFYAVLDSTIGLQRRTALAGAAIIGFAAALLVIRLMGSWSFLDPMRGSIIGVIAAETWWRLRTSDAPASGGRSS